MMNEHFERSEPSKAAAPMPTDIAIGQLLALAKSANFSFDLVNDRLMMCASRPQWRFWAPVRTCLDEIGIEAVEEYFRRTTPDERTALSCVAA